MTKLPGTESGTHDYSFPELEKLLALPAADRLRLADLLMASLPPDTDPEEAPPRDAD